MKEKDIMKRIEEGNLMEKHQNGITLNEYDKYCVNWLENEYVRRESGFYDDSSLPILTKEELKKIIGL